MKACRLRLPEAGARPAPAWPGHPRPRQMPSNPRGTTLALGAGSGGSHGSIPRSHRSVRLCARPRGRVLVRFRPVVAAASRPARRIHGPRGRHDRNRERRRRPRPRSRRRRDRHRRGGAVLRHPRRAARRRHRAPLRFGHQRERGVPAARQAGGEQPLAQVARHPRRRRRADRRARRARQGRRRAEQHRRSATTTSPPSCSTTTSPASPSSR